MKFEDICDCVIVPTNAQENYLLKVGHLTSKSLFEYASAKDEPGERLMPDADCMKCKGNGDLRKQI